MKQIVVTAFVLAGTLLYGTIPACSKKPTEPSEVDEWMTGAEMPTARHLAVAGVIKDRLCIAGGWANQSLDVLEIYNPNTNTWTTGASMPEPRFSAASGVINNKLYVVGGSNVGPSAYEDLASMVIYELDTDSWSTGTPMPEHRDGASGAVINGKFYVAGRDPWHGTGTLDMYDPSTDLWVTRAPMPTERYWAAAAVIDGKLYVVGGDTGGDVSNVLEVYDPALDSWAVLATMPTARRCLTASSIKGLLYVAGGERMQLSAQDEYFDVLEVFDPRTNSWTSKARTPATVNRASAGVIGRKMYIVGGNGWIDVEGGSQWWYVGTLNIYIP